jgi:type I restriction enzyme M protein
MLWIAPSEKDAASTSLEKRLWDAADQFRANSGLKAQEYSGPILGHSAQQARRRQRVIKAR